MCDKRSSSSLMAGLDARVKQGSNCAPMADGDGALCMQNKMPTLSATAALSDCEERSRRMKLRKQQVPDLAHVGAHLSAPVITNSSDTNHVLDPVEGPLNLTECLHVWTVGLPSECTTCGVSLERLQTLEALVCSWTAEPGFQQRMSGDAVYDADQEGNFTKTRHSQDAGRSKAVQSKVRNFKEQSDRHRGSYLRQFG